MSGLLVVIEGIDFAGKTTQAKVLRKGLIEAEIPVVTFKFPSSRSSIGRLIYLALNGSVSLSGYALFALFSADRLGHRKKIEEALRMGRVVICDRYSQSEFAYGGAKGLDDAWTRSIESPMPRPDLLIILDLDVRVALSRKRRGPRDLFERDISFLEEVRMRYLDCLNNVGDSGRRAFVVDAAQSIDQVSKEIWSKLSDLINLRAVRG